ncbi:MAG: Uma2 family endonuclease [Leptolyngbyaceae cyanobacterium SM2_5_2]|nr:Uma2 family endonuclease [Leptolyngbyaceae cyanobacterium SM2_5_2]
MARTLTTWTLEDYHRMIAAGVLAGRAVELLGGQIIDTAPELPIHRATYRRGAKYLESLLGDRAIVFSAAPITLPTNGEPQPDLAIVWPPESRYDHRHPYPEDIYWLIEVSNSTLTYDLGEKAGYYARDFIQEYWVVDIPHQTLWVHRQPDYAGYKDVQAIKSGTVSPLSFPAIAVESGRFWG